VPRHQKRKGLAFLEDASWQSSLSRLSTKGGETGGTRVFSDPLNREFTDKIVNPAETRLAKLEGRHQKELWNNLKNIFGGKAKAEIRLREARKEKTDTGVYIEGEGGKKVEVPMSELQGLEKLLQKRDMELYEDLTRPLEEGGNGFTEKTFEQIEKFVGEDVKKFGEWMYENQKKWGKDVYNPVYRKMEGIDIANFDKGYWPSRKNRQSPYAEKGLTPDAPSGMVTDRAKRRTGVKAPVKYTDALSTYMQYINEATRYNAWAEGHKKLSYVFRNPEVAEAIKQTHGTEAYKNMEYFLDRFAGKSHRVDIPILEDIVNSVGGGILALESMVGIKQTLSSMYYALDMPAAKLAEGTAKSMIRGTVQNDVSKWLDKDPFVQARKDAFLHRDVSTSDTFGKETVGGNKGKVNDALQNAKIYLKHGSNPLKMAQNVFIRIGDKAPITKSGAAYLTHKYHEYSGKKLTKKTLEDHISGKKTDKNLDKAKEDWLMMSSMTQQSVRESNISRLRASGTLARMGTQFTSGQAQIWRVTHDSYRKAQKAFSRGDKAEGMKHVKNMMISHALSGLVFGLANAKFKVDGDNIDEILLSMAMGNLAGVAFLGRGAQYLKDKMLDKPWADSSLGGTPVVATITKGSDAIENILKEREKDNPDEEKLKKNMLQFLNSILTLNGIGAKGATDIVEGYKRLIEGESEYPVHDVLGLGEPYDPDAGKEEKNEDE
jgi:hypothetical protein